MEYSFSQLSNIAKSLRERYPIGKQIVALCFTTFMQTTLLMMGLITMQSHALLGLGVMLAANEVPRIAQHFGLDTSTRFNAMSAVHTTTTAINLTRMIAKK